LTYLFLPAMSADIIHYFVSYSSIVTSLPQGTNLSSCLVGTSQGLFMPTLSESLMLKRRCHIVTHRGRWAGGTFRSPLTKRRTLTNTPCCREFLVLRTLEHVVTEPKQYPPFPFKDTVSCSHIALKNGPRAVTPVHRLGTQGIADLAKVICFDDTRLECRAVYRPIVANH
jgi:hypothetical protein